MFGVAIVRAGADVRADEGQLAQLGFKLRTGASIEPDLLVTVGGRPHAFIVLGGRAQSVHARLSNLQASFKNLYLLAPATYAHDVVFEAAAWPAGPAVIACADSDDVVLAAARLVRALTVASAESGPTAEEVEAHRAQLVLSSAALCTTLQAAGARPAAAARLAELGSLCQLSNSNLPATAANAGLSQGEAAALANALQAHVDEEDGP